MNKLELTTPNISKRDLQLLASQMVESLPKDADPLTTYAKLQKIKVLAESAMSQLKAQALDSIGDDAVTVLGGKMSWMGGGKAFRGKDSFGHNPDWVAAVEEVKRIEGLMKAAEKQPGQPLYDEGVEIPAAKAQTRSTSLKYVF